MKRIKRHFTKLSRSFQVFSRPLYEVLLNRYAGFNEWDYVEIKPFVYLLRKSIFHLTKENGLRNGTVSYYWVSELYNRAPFHFIEDREQEDESNPIQYGKFYWDNDYPDSHVLMDAEALRRKYHPHFFIYSSARCRCKRRNFWLGIKRIS
ncbi:hypothetical protein RCO48_25675 [Peribacillus frigoritolerans]|nr:hypothetical protein [Peribacillus frigoritolerans]